MINKQLKQLCVVKNCFIFESKVYEVLSKHYRYKYRFMISDDDYDYVTDRNLKRRLDRFVKILK